MSYLNMLTKFGAGSAHPGGFTATLDQLQHFRIDKNSSILEVGCGTGRTSCHLASSGYTITAMDYYAEMLEKAKRRADAQQLSIRFVQGDICAIPFANDTFDVVLAESVTNFADAQAALAEYHRVLKPGGILYDRELITAKPIPVHRKTELVDFLGLRQLDSLEQWTSWLHHTQFTDVCHWDYALIAMDSSDQQRHPDDHQYMDADVFADVAALQTSLAYGEILHANRGYLASAVLIGSKPIG